MDAAKLAGIKLRSVPGVVNMLLDDVQALLAAADEAIALRTENATLRAERDAYRALIEAHNAARVAACERAPEIAGVCALCGLGDGECPKRYLIDLPAADAPVQTKEATR